MSATVVQVANWLDQIPGMVELLPTALVVRPAGSSGATIGSPLSHSPVPLNVHALALLDQRERNLAIEMAWVDPDHAGVEPYLWGWVRDIACDLLDAFPDAEPEPQHADAATSCAYLRRHLPFAAILPQWGELADGIQHVYRAVDVATRHLRPGSTVKSIRCGACKRGRLRIAATRCDLLEFVVRACAPRRVPIWMLLAVATAPTRHEWLCTHCRRTAYVRPVTLPQAAAITSPPTQPQPTLRTLQRWANEGRFERVEADGVKLYDLGEIVAAVARHRLERTPARRGRPRKKTQS